SPYQSLSTFAGNEMLIGLEPLARQGLLKSSELKAMNKLPASHVDYGSLHPIKSMLLDRAADRIDVSDSAKSMTKFQQFRARHDPAWLDDYALFRAIKKDQGGKPWWQWPAALAKREPNALAEIRKTSQAAINRVKLQQFLFDQQWNSLRSDAHERGITLFGDVPIYIAHDSADAWARRELVQLDERGRPRFVAGVPPDYFSDEGQLWGNPLYNWAEHDRDGYAWWAQRLEHALQRFDLLRIDHFRGFESYWSVRADHENAKQGNWEPGPGDALFEALEASLGKLPIVAENLGEITPEVESLRKRHGLPGMVILQFEAENPDFDAQAVDQDNVIYTGTHDNDTIRGWFQGRLNDTRTRSELRACRKRAKKLTGGTARTITRDMIRVALQSPARLAMAPLQDFLDLGSEARMNTPGSTSDNWQWRVDPALMTSQFFDSVAGMVQACSRDPEHALQSGSGPGSLK
ncbi:MAG: 4-alpha-glucanotransferase, partial [Xanthomonadales bacterium]|nr:4-alpha-glucanotransferase [Xanthomonadales bacterium]